MTLLTAFLFRRALISRLPQRLALIPFAMLFCALASPGYLTAQAKDAAPDELVLSNGDTLHGKLVNEIGGKVTFHSDPLGDVTLGWDKIKELHTSGNFAVIDKNVKIRGKKSSKTIPNGTIEVANQSLTLHTDNAPAPIPVADAAFIMDKATLDKQLFHSPSFLSGWNGAATAGAAIVTASQNQYTFSGGIGMVRVVPTASWLNPRDRTSFDFSGSYGKITQPAFTIPTTPPTFVPAVVTKSALYHADAERDEYLSPRFFALGQTAFDHNYAQNLDLQQIYGGGIGWTALKTAKQEADLKATIQYEKQQFFYSGSNQNLIGSTLSLSYVLHHKNVVYTQGLAFIPAFNNPHAYSADETNTLAFPAYKNLSFSLGTLDSYINNTPASDPPSKHNSFQFTMGFTYAIKSKY
ncbi:DUF481 domain-containing protein [Telmatobacter sp. DSM 110680]|uniref:DUF481 domain-containing protein n=1 Tax=Telmatobacter sp. DSM 110680 TaxID=3036704 RepID=A0AAU7DQ29_9BACT